MKTVYACTKCGSTDVYSDAWAAMNSDDVLIFDASFCMNCDGECRVEKVEIEEGEGRGE